MNLMENSFCHTCGSNQLKDRILWDDSMYRSIQGKMVKTFIAEGCQFTCVHGHVTECTIVGYAGKEKFSRKSLDSNGNRTKR